MDALGVTDFRFLGGAGRYRDSGMMGTPANEKPRAFWNADLDEAVAHAVAVVRETRPQVVVTYDENGGYGHPDHIQAHRVAMGAVEAAADPAYRPELGEPWSVAKVYWCCIPRSVLQEGIEAMAAAGDDVLLRGRHQRRRPPLRRARRGRHRRRRRPCVRRPQGRRDARPPDPDHGRRAVLRPVEQPRPGGARRSSTTGWSGASAGPGSSAPNGWEDDLFAGLGPDEDAVRALDLAGWALTVGSRPRLARPGRGVLAAAAGGGRAVPGVDRRRGRRATCCSPAWRCAGRDRAWSPSCRG